MKSRVLVDSRFLRVLYDPKERQYKAALEAAELRDLDLIVPDVVLTETAYLFMRDGGVLAVIRFLDTLRAARPPD
jgi:predicted nucleic acid-binding protein